MYKKLEKVLNERGITMYKLAKETGISTATLSHWKQGKYEPKYDKKRAIADYLGIPVEELIEHEEVTT